MLYVNLRAYEFEDVGEPDAETKTVKVNPLQVATFGPYSASMPDITVISFAGSEDVMFVAGTPDQVEATLTNTSRMN